MAADLDISIVIATRNRDAILKKTLQSMQRLNRSGINAEFVIVDNNSSDNTKQIVTGFADRLPVRYLFEPKLGQNYARNRALDQAQLGKIVAFTDDDIEPDENWLASIIAAAKRWPNHSIFGGKIYPIWPNGKLPKWTKNLFVQQLGFAHHSYADNECLYAAGQYPSSANFWVRREIITNGRRFDESIAWHAKNQIMATETTFLQKLTKQGCHIVYCPSAVVGHKITSEQLSMKYLIKRAYSWGRGMAYIKPLCRRDLLTNRPVLWRLIRIGAIARLNLALIASLIPLILGKPKKTLYATQWIGYNIETLKIAKKNTPK